MPAQVLILLARTPPKRNSATLHRLRKRSIDDGESGGGSATTRGLHSVAFHTRREYSGAMCLAREARSPTARERRFRLLTSYTTTLRRPPRWSASATWRSGSRQVQQRQRGREPSFAHRYALHAT